MKPVKALIYLILILAGLTAAAAIAAILLVDPNDHKEEIAQLVKKNTGRTLTIKEDLSLSLFPWVGISLGALELENAAGFGSKPFARVSSVDVKVKLLPLLSKEVEVAVLSIKGLALNLAKNAQGKTNWDDLASGGSEEKAPSPSPTGKNAPADEAGGGTPLAGLAIYGVEVTDAALVWDDRSTDARYALDKINLTLGRLEEKKPVDLNLNFHLTSREPSLDLNLDLTSAAMIDLAAQRYLLAIKKLTAKARGYAIPGGRADLTAALSVNADLAQKTAKLTGLRLTAMGLEVTGEAAADAILSTPGFKGNVALAEFSPKGLLNYLGQTAPETSDAQVLQKAAFGLSFQGNANRVDLSDIALTLDDSRFQGTAGVVDFAQPAIRWDLQLDAIDIDRYLPPSSADEEEKAADETTPAPAPTPQAEGGEAGLPLETLRALKLDGRFRAGKVKLSNLRAEEMLVTVKAKDGLITIDPMGAKLYEGRLDGGVALDARKDEPRITVKQALKGFRAAPFLKDLTGNDPVGGRADLSLNVTMRGTEPEAIKQTLNGKTRFAFTDGAVNGVNLPRMIRNAYNTLKGRPLEPEGSFQKTDFTSLTGSAAIKNGVVNNPDLAMDSPLLRIRGAGSADLPQNQVDYLVQAKIVGSLAGQGGEPIDDLKNLTVPVKVTGDLASPAFSLDMEALLKENLKGKAKEKIKQKLEEKLKKKGLGDLMKALPF